MNTRPPKWNYPKFLICSFCHTLIFSASAKPIRIDAVAEWQTNKVIEVVYFKLYFYVLLNKYTKKCTFYFTRFNFLSVTAKLKLNSRISII